MPITLRQLEIFSAVAKFNSISKAAQYLKLSQPAVSKQIHQMERLLGVPVVDIIRQRVHITDMGRRVLQHAHMFDELLLALNDTVCNNEEVLRGTLRVSVGTSVSDLMLKFYGEFYKKHPEISFKLSVGFREKLLEQLLDNTSDMVIMPRPFEYDNLVSYPIRKFNYVMVASASHPLAEEKSIKLEQLLDETFIFYSRQIQEQDLIKQLFELSYDIRHIDIDNVVSVKRALQEKLGIAMLPDYMLPKNPKSEKLAILNVKGLPVEDCICLVHLKNKKLSNVSSEFKDYLLERKI
jgi:LysR family transcriptional regulator, low CO2-responsive transcriptional regulator